MNRKAVLGLLLMMPLLALAGPFEPSAGDASMKLIKEVLSDQSPIAGILKLFASVCLLVGGIMLAYVVVVGTVSTAHDGEMMGKRWSSVWVPIRLAVGVALTLPIKAGFCGAMLIVIWIATQGIGAANLAWSGFATSGVASGDLLVQPHNPRIEAFAAQTLSALVCVEAINHVISQTSVQQAMGATPATVSFEKETMGNIGYTFGLVGSPIVKKDLINFGGGAIDKAGCGQVQIESKTTGGGGLNVLGEAGSNRMLDIKWVGLQKSIVPPSATEAAHRQAVVSLIEGLRPLAKAIVKADDAGWAAADAQKSSLASSMAAYRQIVVSAAMGEAKTNGLDGMAAAMSEDGWMLAGAWFLRIVKTQNDINSAIEAVPQIHAGLPVVSMFADELQRSQIRLNSFLKSAGGSQYAINSFAAKGDESPNESASSAMNLIVKAFSGIDMGSLGTDPRNPLIVVKDMGDRLLAWGGGGMAALVGASFLGAGLLGSLLGPIIGMLLMAGFSAGILMSIYTPFIPYMIWMGAFIGWLILLLEAIIAAPLWAVMMIAPDGDGLVGNAKQALLLLLSLALRPILMIFGIVSAMSLLGPLGHFINDTAGATLALTSGSGIEKIIASLGGVFIYAALMMAMIHALFSLIHIIPDRVMRWIGVNDVSTASHAQDAEQRGKTIVAGIGVSSQNVASRAGNAAARANNKNPGGGTPAPQTDKPESKPTPENKSTTTGSKK